MAEVPVHPPRPRRLVAVTPPIAGESLLSLIVRHCELNIIPRPSDLLLELGIPDAKPAFAPFTLGGFSRDLAAAIGVAEAEILQRMYPRAERGDLREGVIFNGIELERRFLEANVRRVSPSSLRLSEHHRALWLLRPVGFCPETMTLLLDRCPICRGSLGWTACRCIGRCDKCGADLTDASTAQVPEHFTHDAIAVADLVGPSDVTP